jgi:hypothetical protein
MPRANIDIEEKMATKYGRHSMEIEDPDLKKLLQRIRDEDSGRIDPKINEDYHHEVFNDLLQEEEGR